MARGAERTKGPSNAYYCQQSSKKDGTKKFTRKYKNPKISLDAGGSKRKYRILYN
jgi:hypothetical protein